MERDGEASANAAGQRTSAAYLIGVAVVVAFVLGWTRGFVSPGDDGSAALARPALPASPRPFDASRFVLNGLLVPAIDSDAVPLRWVDPRAALHCGPGASVRVNGTRVAPGTPVPDTPFDLDWHAVACRPFGSAGPRFDGNVRLTVYREDWGFSAAVAPASLRITANGHEPVVVARGAATTPQSAASEDAAANQADYSEPARHAAAKAIDQRCTTLD
ncbi:MAG: hypothetical protein U1F15_05130 [Burkholderiales bacterium]